MGAAAEGDASTAGRTAAITAQALAAGVTLAGLAPAAALRQAPSYRGSARPQIWPGWARGVLVLALAHPANEPELDWWGGSWGTLGNRTLAHSCSELQRWLAAEGVQAAPLPYQVTAGGIFLKDAAALAGLGRIGQNNLLITPVLGPRVRLRALLVDIAVAAGEPPDFAPCEGCAAPCRRACPQQAWGAGLAEGYRAERCSVQMRLDEHRTHQGSGYRIAYCRACELACPVGR